MRFARLPNVADPAHGGFKVMSPAVRFHMFPQERSFACCFWQGRPGADAGDSNDGTSFVLPGAALRRIITVGGSNGGGGGDASFASSADSDGATTEKTHKVRHI